MSYIVCSGTIILVSALSAIAFPFTTYATTLATFGIAHVAIELRYIDRRFHQNSGTNIKLRLVRNSFVTAATFASYKTALRNCKKRD